MSDAEARWDRDLNERATPSPLLQTWGWGEVQSRAGWAVERVGLAGRAMASVQLRGLGRVREAYVPRGPVPACRAEYTSERATDFNFECHYFLASSIASWASEIENIDQRAPPSVRNGANPFNAISN